MGEEVARTDEPSIKTESKDTTSREIKREILSEEEIDSVVREEKVLHLRENPSDIINKLRIIEQFVSPTGEKNGIVSGYSSATTTVATEGTITSKYKSTERDTHNRVAATRKIEGPTIIRKIYRDKARKVNRQRK